MLVSAKAGICQTCRHASYCSLANGSPGERVECEEFEVAGSGFRSVAPPPRPAPRRSRDAAAAEPDVLGLCQNCRMRASCRLPRPEGGIWFCEEYEVE